MSDMQTSLNRLLDEAAIRKVTARFAEAAIRADYANFRSVWAENADWTIGTPPKAQAKGLDDIVALFRRLRGEKDFFVQYAIQGPIDIDGDTATTSCVCYEAARGGTTVHYRTHCIAIDHLKRAGDGWVFTSRTFQYLWLDTSPFTGDSFSLPAIDSAI